MTGYCCYQKKDAEKLLGRWDVTVIRGIFGILPNIYGNIVFNQMREYNILGNIPNIPSSSGSWEKIMGEPLDTILNNTPKIYN